jgi:TM2 domain-containing membrane protein YozV
MTDQQGADETGAALSIPQTTEHDLVPAPTSPSLQPPAYAPAVSGQSSTGVTAELFRAQSEYEDERKSTGIAYLLWAFLGFFGGHRFYLRQTGTAVAMLVISLTVVGLLVTSIWALVDAFLIPGLTRKINHDTRRNIYTRHRVALY